MRVRPTNLTLWLLVCVLSLGAAVFERIPEEPGRGEEWLRWSKETRELLIYAYVVGYQEGSIDSCAIADELFAPGKMYQDPKEFPMARCMLKMKQYSRPIDFYTGTITRFYKRFPDDRKFPARSVLRKLYDGADTTLQNLHEMAQTGELIH